LIKSQESVQSDANIDMDDLADAIDQSQEEKMQIS